MLTMLTPVVPPEDLQRLHTFLCGCRHAVITCHKQPDGDALGSCLAMQEWLRSQGKEATVVVPSGFPDFLQGLPHSNEVLIYEHCYARCRALIGMADLIIVLDLNAPDRLAELADPIQKARCRKLLIDHHENPQQFCDLQISHPTMSSTCELLLRLIDAMGEMQHVSHDCAEALLAGILTDTGRLSYNSNDPEIYLIVAELIRRGVDKDKLVRKLYNQQYESRYRLMGYVLSEKLEILPEAHAALFSLTREELTRFHFMRGDMEGVVNMPLEIKGTRVSISLREDTEKPEISVSIRSVDDFSAQDMAERFFHGGGHFNAAGGRLRCSMEEALRIAHEAIAYYNTSDTCQSTPSH